MKFYDVNINWGKAEVEVELQSEEYKGKFSTIVCGNVLGERAIDTVLDCIQDGDIEILKSNCNLEIILAEEYDDEDFFTCDLKDDKGNELNIEMPLDYLNNYIVGIKIIKYEEYKD